MIDLALDPSETRPVAAAMPRTGVRRPWVRIALLGALGVAGTGAFAGVASTYLSDLAGPQRAKPLAMNQKASDWPDLKDGMPALAGGGPAIPKIREILPPEPTPAPVVEARVDPMLRADSMVADPAAAAAAPVVGPSSAAVGKSRPATSKPLPAIVEAPVIGPARQAALVAPARAVTGIAPLAAETVRAETGTVTYAALPPEPPKAVAGKPTPSKDVAVRHEGAKPEIAKPEIAKPEASKPEAAKTKPRGEAHAKPAAVPAAKAVAEKPAARKPAAVEAKAAPAEAQDEDTEVFGIKVPSFAPAGRKIRESVEALGDAVKGIPGRF